MADLLARLGRQLAAGASALDMAAAAVRELEASGHHVAGRGAWPNLAGRWQLDAALMDGETRRAGAVAALEGVRHPIDAARAVMERTPHVLLAGEGAAAFARAQGLETIDRPETWYVNQAPKARTPRTADLAHGTVGAVALDIDGSLAAATSTGGVLDKLPGRVGDTPLIGAGTWADERVAVSCTGVGEYFIRAAAAVDVSTRIRYARADLDAACDGALSDVKYLGGEGGLIAIDCLGRIAMKFTTAGMKRGSVGPSGDVVVRVGP
jgi:isoaspartyl peptidase/L-asparaginase-like protein (Ntn-hydrolase superfamily)